MIHFQATLDKVTFDEWGEARIALLIPKSSLPALQDIVSLSGKVLVISVCNDAEHKSKGVKEDDEDNV